MGSSQTNQCPVGCQAMVLSGRERSGLQARSYCSAAFADVILLFGRSLSVSCVAPSLFSKCFYVHPPEGLKNWYKIGWNELLPQSTVAADKKQSYKPV